MVLLVTTCCAFRWKEFCMDTSLEKASLYLQNDNGNSRSSIHGLTMPECLLDWPDVATGGNHSIVRYEHFTFIFHCSLFLTAFVLLTHCFVCQPICAYCYFKKEL
jgi:hypothetical protein